MAYLLNARSVVNKLQELRYMLYAVKMYLLFVTETWLNENVPTGCLDPESHYYVMRCDRKCDRGGGVCAFIHKSLCPVEIHVAVNYKDLELLCFDLSCSTTKMRFFLHLSPTK